MKKNAQYGIFLFTLLLHYCTFSLAQDFSTKLYTTADGLSDNYIFSIYQDSYGYLWIGTANGLNRFDGKQFLTYGIQQGLPSMLVDRIYEDHHHRLWIGTRNGIAELKGDSCYTYRFNDNQHVTFISSFLEPDSSKLWATTNKGLYEFRKDQWIKINLVSGYENAGIGKIICTKKGMYINYDNNKLLFRTNNKKVQTLLSVKSNAPFYNSLHCLNDSVFISIYSGLLEWNMGKWHPLYQDTLSKKYIYTSFRDKNNRWWFGTKQDGILTVAPNGTKTAYTHIPLSFNLVSSFFQDRDNNIWVAGFQGLLKISPSYYKTVWLPEFDKMHFIRNCFETPSGKIVLSGENGELLLLQSSADAHLKIIASKQLKNTNDFIDFYTFDEKERVWFSTREGKLYRLDDTTLKDFTSIVKFKNKGFSGLAYNKRTKKLYACADSVFLAGDENKLDTFFDKQKNFIPLPYLVYLQNDGSMLVQTLYNGVFLITNGNEAHVLNKELIFQYVQGDNNSNAIWTVFQGKGIAKYFWKENNLPQLEETITKQNGLAENYILNVVQDQDKLWIVTTKGITLMQKNGQKNWIHQDFEINANDDHLPLSFAKLSKDEYGHLWMNTGNKLLYFDENKIKVNPVYSTTVIENILLYNRATNWTQLTDSVYSYRNLPFHPVLNHNQNTLSIVFNAIQFSDNSQLEYSYRLKPSDNSWSNPTKGNVVSFYALNPGNYTFEVRSHIKGFDWSIPATFSFIITKPYWEAWWFRVITILISAALIFFIFRYRLKELKTKTEMQNQLHELETKAFKLQMNPHFIHNALNSIQSLVINHKNIEASHYISKFAKLLRQVLENSDKNLISLEKELYSLQLYVELEQWRMNMKIDYEVNIDETIDPSLKIPPLILQPFIENAIWHGLSKKDGEKKIVLSIAQDKQFITCVITDNGIGRKMANEFSTLFPEGHLSKAINIIRHRLSDFNQTPGMDPISFVDLEKNQRAAGTKVIVKIKPTFS